MPANSDRNISCAGTAIIELLICSIVLTYFIVNMYDLGNALWEHASITQMTREIARDASGTPELEIGSYELAEGGGTSCGPAGGAYAAVMCSCAGCPANQLSLLQRSYEIVRIWEEREGLAVVDGFRRIAVTRGAGGVLSNEVKVRVRLKYNGIFFPYNNFTVGTEHTLPYL